MDPSEEELEAVDEIGPEVAGSIVTFFGEKENREVVEETRQAGLSLGNPFAQEQEQPLEGLTFVFTGELERWTRDEVKRYVEQLGARATSSVSGETDYVVAGPGAGSKLDEAEAQEIPVMDEAGFIEFVKDRRPGGVHPPERE